MYYKKFNNIYVANSKDVCAVGKETQLMAECANKINAKTAIDIGSGTGFIAIYLASNGVDCTATDISKESINLIKINAKKNKFDIKIKKSDLLASIDGIFDIIIFNTPLVRIKPKYTKITRYIRKFFPNGLSVISTLAFRSQEKNRKVLLQRLLHEVKDHCHQKSKLILFIHKKELYLFNKYNFKILNKYADFRIIIIDSLI